MDKEILAARKIILLNVKKRMAISVLLLFTIVENKIKHPITVDAFWSLVSDGYISIDYKSKVKRI